MGDTDSSAERRLQQASANQSALFFVALSSAKQRGGSVDAWAGFVGDQFAESWNEMRGAGAREVARKIPVREVSATAPQERDLYEQLAGLLVRRFRTG
jgi:hypothetical protein